MKKFNRVAVTSNCGKNIVLAIKKEQEAAIFKDAIQDIPTDKWVAIKLSSKIQKPDTFEVQEKLVTTLEIQDIEEKKVKLPKQRKEYTGFWKKLKLAFSKKVAYTEE